MKHRDILIPTLGLALSGLALGQVGIITTVAGNGTAGYYGDGGPATSAELSSPFAVTVDGSGNLYILDLNNRIRKVAAGTEIITMVAGNGFYYYNRFGGSGGYSGDGGPATSAELNSPSGVAVDGSGNLYIADEWNSRVRKVAAGTGIITTVAGGGTGGLGDGGPATSAEIFPTGIAVDAGGNLYIADPNRIRKVAAGTGIITTVAGNGYVNPSNGTGGYSGDGGPATSAELNNPEGVAVDGSGNLYIADFGNNRIRKVAAGTGIITTVAGNGTGGYSGDGGPATSAELSSPWAVAVDGGGNLYIADSSNQRIREVVAGTGIIATVAGNGYLIPPGEGGYGGDGGPATGAELNNPYGVAVDGAGNIYIADYANFRVREVLLNAATSPGNPQCANIAGTWNATESGSYTQTIAATVETDTETSPVSGRGTETITQNGCSVSYTPTIGPLSSTSLTPSQLASLTRTGTVSGNDVSFTGLLGIIDFTASAQAGFTVTNVSSNIVTAAGQVTGNVMTLNETGTLVASGTYSVSGQTGSFTETISSSSVASFTQTQSNSFLTVTSTALAFQLWQGAPAQSQPVLIGGTANAAWQATATSAVSPWLSVSPGSGKITEWLVATVDPSGLTPGTYQGSITIQTQGATPISTMIAVALTVTAASGQSVTMGRGALITTVAGNGTAGYSGDSGPATGATLNNPQGVAVDGSGNLYIVDGTNGIRKVAAGAGTITTVAGSGTAGYSGDSGPATSATLKNPQGVAVDAGGNLYVADVGNYRIRKVAAGTGIITTVAGNGKVGYSGDGGSATSATLNSPQDVAVDGSGNLYIADAGNYRIRKVAAGTGIITTVAGNGTAAYSGDGGPATSATLNSPQGVAVDGSGNLYIADVGNYRIRKVAAGTGIITTVAGNGTADYSGDGVPATSAQIIPQAVALDSAGNLYIADNLNRIRAVDAGPGIITTVAGTGVSGYSGDGNAANSAELNDPSSVAVDSGGNLYFADTGNNRIRRVSTSSSTTLPASVISGLSPSSATAGGAAFALTVNGSGFVSGSAIEWNGTPVMTNYVSATQLNASILASLSASAGSVSVTVLNPGASASNAVMFTINPAPPTISGLSPSSATAGGAAFTLTVNGSEFVSGSNVAWNGAVVATSFVSATQLTATISASLIAFPGGASVTVLNPTASASNAMTFPVFSSGANVQTISHIADGGGWRSSIILVNTDTVPALYAVNFWSDAGASYAPPSELGSATGSIPVGGSRIIETADTASALSEGWAEVMSNQSVGGTAIFRYDPSSQEAAVPLLTSGGVKLKIPYQVGSGLSLGIALANPSATQTANITEVIRDQNGNQLASRTLTLAALNHTAFLPAFPSGVTGGGVVEYDANVNIFGLGIRSAGQAFTSLDAVLPLAASTKTISHIADGGGWRSSIILVNTDTVPVSYTVSFWNDSGASYAPPLALGSTTGSIPVGGSTIIETADTASSLSEGWAEVMSNQSVGGTAIFRYDPSSQEAAVPLLTSGGLKLEIPYQVGSGLSLGVALANPSATQTANITEVIRDQNGNQLASRTLTLGALNHTAFNPTFPSGITGGGVVEYDSNVNIFALGIRSAPEGGGLAFTSVRAAYK